MYLDKYLTEEDINTLSDHVTVELVSQIYSVIIKNTPSVKQQALELLKKLQ